MKSEYSLFVNGKFICSRNNFGDISNIQAYADIYQRGLGIAMYLGIAGYWENSKSELIIDRWTNGENLIIIQKKDIE